MASPEQIKKWAHKTAPRDWYGACAGLTYNTIVQNGGTSDAYGSATAAFNATRIEGHRAQDAPAGAIHYWSYFGTDWRGIRGDWGHVAVDIFGGGHSILSATRRYREQWAIGAGLISVAAQTVPGMTYLGWSMTYGRRGRISIAVPSGGGSTPFPPTPTKPKEWDEMASPEEIDAIVFAAVQRAGVSLFPFVVNYERAAEGDPRKGISWGIQGGLFVLTDEQLAWFNGAKDTPSGRHLNHGLRTFYPSNPREYDHYRTLCEGPPPWARGGIDPTGAFTAGGVTAGGATDAQVLESIRSVLPEITDAARVGIDGATIRAAAK